MRSLLVVSLICLFSLFSCNSEKENVTPTSSKPLVSKGGKTTSMSPAEQRSWILSNALGNNQLPSSSVWNDNGTRRIHYAQFRRPGQDYEFDVQAAIYDSFGTYSFAPANIGSSWHFYNAWSTGNNTTNQFGVEINYMLMDEAWADGKADVVIRVRSRYRPYSDYNNPGAWCDYVYYTYQVGDGYQARSSN